MEGNLARISRRARIPRRAKLARLATGARRTGLALSLLLLAAAAASGEGTSAPAPAAGEPAGAGAPALGRHLAAIAALGVREEGSRSEAAAFEYIEDALRKTGLSPVASGFNDAHEGYSSSRILEASAAGKREDELAIVVPVGSWAGSTDPFEGAYGIALALAEAEALAAERVAGRSPPISTRFVFLGAERRGLRADGGETASLGSRTWIARQGGRERLAVVYLDFEGGPGRIALLSAGAGVLSPYWLYEGSRQALDDSGAAYLLEANRLQAFRLGLARDFGPSAPYLEAGIPAIELRGDGPAIGAAEAAPSGEWLGRFVRSLSDGLASGFPDTWDRHYFIARIGGLGLVVREYYYIVFIVAFIALAALSFLAATVARRDAAKRILKRAPAMLAELLALFAALCLVFIAGKLIAALDARALGSSRAWELHPRLFAAARVAFSFFLFLSFLSILVDRKTLTPNPYFYEFAALVCLAVDVLAFSTSELSASFYFLWAFMLVELSLAIRRRWATLVAYVVMYAPLLFIEAELASRPGAYAYAYGKLIAPGFLDVAALSALTLPFFVFTASPLLFFVKPGSAARRKEALLLALAALAVEASALAWAAAASPRAGPERRDLSISETVDQDAGTFEAVLSGKGRLGAGAIELGGQSLEYRASGDRAVLRGRDFARRIAIASRSTVFLDRIDEGVRIDFADPPYSVDLELESGSEILIYDCSLPYKVAVDGRSARIFAGVLPGRELSFSLTVPSSFSARIAVTARYLAALGTAAESSGARLADGGLSARATAGLGTAAGAR